MYEVFLALLSGWIVFYFAVFLPGPNTFFVASVGMGGNKHQIWGAAIGTAIGSFTWCLLSTTGISFLISNLMGWGFLLLKILASLYMLYLAYQIGKQYFFDANFLGFSRLVLYEMYIPRNFGSLESFYVDRNSYNFQNHVRSLWRKSKEPKSKNNVQFLCGTTLFKNLKSIKVPPFINIVERLDFPDDHGELMDINR